MVGSMGLGGHDRLHGVGRAWWAPWGRELGLWWAPWGWETMMGSMELGDHDRFRGVGRA